MLGLVLATGCVIQPDTKGTDTDTDTDPVDTDPDDTDPGTDSETDTDDTELPVDTGHSDPLKDTDPPVDTGDSDTDVLVDTAPYKPSDSADTDDTDPFWQDTGGVCVDGDQSWWLADVDGDGQPDLNHRVLVTVTGGTQDQLRPPVSLDLDFRALLDAQGISEAFDANSVRIVVQDCAGGFPAVPAQFSDGFVGLLSKTDHADPMGDEAGSVSFLFDTDGDPASSETLAAGDSLTFGIYFASKPAGTTGLPAAVTPTNLVIGASSLANGQSLAVFDPAQGGLLQSLSYQVPAPPPSTATSSGTLASQTDACCGNAVIGAQDPGWTPPSAGAAAASSQIVAFGPLVAAFRATGTVDLTDSSGTVVGSYTYDHHYWMWNGRPELWHSTQQSTTMTMLNEHVNDASFGFRPVQTIHTLLSLQTPTHHEDLANGRYAVDGTDYGYAVALVEGPTHLTDVVNPVLPVTAGNPTFDEYAYIAGNDWQAGPMGTPVSIPANTTYFDNISMVMVPYVGGFATAQPEVTALQEGVSPTAAAAEYRWAP